MLPQIKSTNYNNLQELHNVDGELTGTVMRAIDEADFPQRVYTFSYSSSPDFGRVGWERTYPMPWNQVYADGEG